MEADITTLIRGERKLSFSEKLLAAFRLSVPAMIAMLTSILMQYIDVAMVGSLGAEASASIGAVESTTWFFGSIVNSAIYGFSVQIAHAVGSGNGDRAKNIYRQGFKVILLISLLLSVVGILISGKLPIWLGAEEVLHRDASFYFLIYIGFMPLGVMGLYTAS
jgi:Na+-driven multidrug efflux pump